MNTCPSCHEKSAARHTYCGSCGNRIQPVGAKLRQDILSTIRDERKQRRTVTFAVASIVIGLGGFFGWQWLNEKVSTTVASQVSALMPGIVNKANAKAEDVMKRELNRSVDRWVSEAQKISSHKQRLLEDVYLGAEREVKEKGRRLSNNFQATASSSVSQPSTAAMFAFPNTARDGFQIPPLSGETHGLMSEVGRKILAASDFEIWTAKLAGYSPTNSSSAAFVAFTTYDPVCSPPRLALDNLGVAYSGSEDCKKKYTNISSPGPSPVQ